MAGVLSPYGVDRPRRNETPTPETIEAGQRFRLGRRQAGLSQRRVAERSGISQSEISRLERGKTPGMSAYRVFAIALALGDKFPFGTCPHQHRCAYSAEASRNEGLTRLGVINMSDPEDDIETDAAGRLKSADLMPPADSFPADDDATDSDAAGRFESADLMAPADFQWRRDGWWDGPQRE